MANIKGQIKRNRQNEKRRLRNKGIRSEINSRVKTALKNAESHVLQTLSNFKKPSEEAVKLAIKAIDFEWKASMEGTKNLAMAINEAISRGDAFDVWNRFSILHEITPEDVIRVVQQYFDTDKMTVVEFLPGLLDQNHTENGL